MRFFLSQSNPLELPHGRIDRRLSCGCGSAPIQRAQTVAIQGINVPEKEKLMEKIHENMTSAYQQKIRAELKELKAQMMKMQAKAEQSGADVRLKYQKRAQEMNARVKEINDQLEKVSNSAEGAWEEIRGGVDRSLSELKKSLDQAGQEMKQ